MMESNIADHFEFDTVPIEEIEPPPGFIIAVAEGFQSRSDHSFFCRCQIINLQAHMVQRHALGLSRMILPVGIERQILIFGADVERLSQAALTRTALAWLPSQQLLQQCGRAVHVSDGQIHMFDKRFAHTYVFLV